MIKVIAFDLWDTLVPSTIDWTHLVSLAKVENFSLSEFISRYERATQLKEHNSFEELRKAFFHAFKQFDNELLEQEFYEVVVNRIDKVRFFPESKKVLKKLRGEGYKLALISNTESLTFKKVKAKLALPDFFDFLVLSYDVGVIKPDKKIFQKVIERFKVKPEEVLMIGDSLRSDVLGAQSLGIHNCWINRKSKQSLDGAKPEFVVKNLEEIYKVIGTLNAVDK